MSGIEATAALRDQPPGPRGPHPHHLRGGGQDPRLHSRPAPRATSSRTPSPSSSSSRS
ncbi:MAG: hypothetical protein M0C28_25490 [Candidatus Moduliflexus flocculans]|nr:hypothetical protein [Candidatus Moduliflexus flocculans]